jgi:hypothetical protein
LPSRSSKDR